MMNNERELTALFLLNVDTPDLWRTCFRAPGSIQYHQLEPKYEHQYPGSEKPPVFCEYSQACPPFRLPVFTYTCSPPVLVLFCSRCIELLQQTPPILSSSGVCVGLLPTHFEQGYNLDGVLVREEPRKIFQFLAMITHWIQSE